MTASHIAVGLKGEEAAAHYLEAGGFRIVARRYRCGKSDIDLIARATGGSLHFIEVKTRSLAGARENPYSDLSPAAAVTPAKVEHMLRAAEYYMAESGETVEVSVDLVTVLLDSAANPVRILHYSDLARF